jgi:hypothetical protein
MKAKKINYHAVTKEVTAEWIAQTYDSDTLDELLAFGKAYVDGGKQYLTRKEGNIRATNKYFLHTFEKKGGK